VASDSFDFLIFFGNTFLEATIFSYALATSLGFLVREDTLELPVSRDSVVPSPAIVAMESRSAQATILTHARVTPVTPLLVCVYVCDFSLLTGSD
jgi:hypothetical protein